MYLYFIAVYFLIAGPNVAKVCYFVSGDLTFRIVETERRATVPDSAAINFLFPDNLNC